MASNLFATMTITRFSENVCENRPGRVLKRAGWDLTPPHKGDITGKSFFSVLCSQTSPHAIFGYVSLTCFSRSVATDGSWKTTAQKTMSIKKLSG